MLRRLAYQPLPLQSMLPKKLLFSPPGTSSPTSGHRETNRQGLLAPCTASNPLQDWSRRLPSLLEQGAPSLLQPMLDSAFLPSTAPFPETLPNAPPAQHVTFSFPGYFPTQQRAEGPSMVMFFIFSYFFHFYLLYNHNC